MIIIAIAHFNLQDIITLFAHARFGIGPYNLYFSK